MEYFHSVVSGGGDFAYESSEKLQDMIEKTNDAEKVEIVEYNMNNFHVKPDFTTDMLTKLCIHSHSLDLIDKITDFFFEKAVSDEENEIRLLSFEALCTIRNKIMSSRIEPVLSLVLNRLPHTNAIRALGLFAERFLPDQLHQIRTFLFKNFDHDLTKKHAVFETMSHYCDLIPEVVEYLFSHVVDHNNETSKAAIHSLLLISNRHSEILDKLLAYGTDATTNNTHNTRSSEHNNEKNSNDGSEGNHNHKRPASVFHHTHQTLHERIQDNVATVLQEHKRKHRKHHNRNYSEVAVK